MSKLDQPTSLKHLARLALTIRQIAIGEKKPELANENRKKYISNSPDIGGLANPNFRPILSTISENPEF